MPPPLPKYVTVPPASIVDLAWGQEVHFQSMQQNWTICFGLDQNWSELSGQTFSNQPVKATAPNVNTDINYNVVTVGACVVPPPIGTGSVIHVRSTGGHKK